MKSNYVSVGKTIACSHCNTENMFEPVEKYGLICECICHTPHTMQEEIKALKENIKFLESQRFYDRLGMTIATILWFVLFLLVK
jgi:hypothetical protein